MGISCLALFEGTAKSPVLERIQDYWTDTHAYDEVGKSNQLMIIEITIRWLSSTLLDSHLFSRMAGRVFFYDIWWLSLNNRIQGAMNQQIPSHLHNIKKITQ